jgi:hypothetical protein
MRWKKSQPRNTVEHCSRKNPGLPVGLPVIFREEAEADMAEAALWYERRSLGLGAPRQHARDDHAPLPPAYPVLLKSSLCSGSFLI